MNYKYVSSNQKQKALDTKKNVLVNIINVMAKK